MITIKQAWQLGRAELESSPTPTLDARLLLESALGRPHSYLVAHGDEALPPEVEARFRDGLARAARQEPIPYITGRAPFFGLELVVSPAVLIPRPETEMLVERAIRWATGRDGRPVRIVDVGTGSGAIAVALAAHLPQADVWATDLSAGALAIAEQNVMRHTPGRVALREGDLLEPVAGRFDLIAANLPYVTDAEWTALDDGVKWYEPELALKGGPDGLALIRRLLAVAEDRLEPRGLILLEIGWQQGDVAVRLACNYFPRAAVELWADFAGNDRLVTIDTARTTARPAGAAGANYDS